MMWTKGRIEVPPEARGLVGVLWQKWTEAFIWSRNHHANITWDLWIPEQPERGWRMSNPGIKKHNWTYHWFWSDLSVMSLNILSKLRLITKFFFRLIWLGWSGNSLGSSRRSWRKCPRRGKSGRPCSNCCSCNPAPDERGGRWMNGWMFVQQLKNQVCALIYWLELINVIKADLTLSSTNFIVIFCIMIWICTCWIKPFKYWNYNLHQLGD